MINLTDSAEKRLDKYLQEMRTCLRDCATVDADEVEQNITEHIENELAAAAEPVSLNNLNIVLEKLGSPSQWIPEEELPWWRKAILRLRTGPDDWRLAYISFALLLWFLYLVRGINLEGMFGLPIMIIDRPAVGLIFWMSFLIARAAVREAAAREELGAQKWLIYPPLLSMYITAFLLILLWPWVFIAPRLNCILQAGVSGSYVLNLALFFGGLITSISWVGLGVLFFIRPKLLSFLLRPFADKFSRTFARLVLLSGIGITVVFATLLIWWQYT
jgi:hypothetical protein